MKKTILALAVVALAGASVQTARAGDNEWALAGKVLTGVAAASIVARAVIPPPPVYAYSANYGYAPSYSYNSGYNNRYNHCPPPVVYAPSCPPAVVYRSAYRAPAYPVYVAPSVPVVGFRVGGGNHRHHHHRGHW